VKRARYEKRAEMFSLFVCPTRPVASRFCFSKLMKFETKFPFANQYRRFHRNPRPFADIDD